MWTCVPDSSRPLIGSVTASIETPGRRLGGVDVLGFFTAEHGVGEAARGLVSALDAAGISRNAVNYTDTESRTAHEFETQNVSEFQTLFAALNADHLPAARQIMGNDFWTNRYVISQWFWELEVSPPWFHDAFPMVNELWAPTRFIEQMLRRSAPEGVAVRYMPPAVEIPFIDPALTKDHFGLGDRFTFYFSFDFMSIAKRKNAVGLVRAFRKAFAENSGPQLVIKSMNGDKREFDLWSLKEAIGERSDITLMTDYLTRVEASTMTSLADCYVSLHRSEGLGLTITEALSLGVPVIATGYSGNLDFMDEWNTWRVPCSMTQVGSGAGGYPKDALWAEPDLDEAARMMREVFENPSAAKAKAAKARDHVLNAFSVEAAGTRMRQRLEDIWAELGRG